jgi:NADH-quinone oxidoreductase subunit N
VTADVVTLLPEVVLALGAVLGLLVGSFLPPGREAPVRWVGIAAAVATIVVALVGPVGASAFGGTYTVDVATTTVRVLVAGAVAVTLVLAGDPGAGGASNGTILASNARTAPLTQRAGRSRTAFAVLVQLSGVGAMVLGGASDLLLLAAAVLLAGLPLAALAGLARDGRAAEAALKYFLSSALFGLVLLTGVTVLLGLTGARAYAALGRVVPPVAGAVALLLVLVGLLMTLGGVPAHFWVPDAVDGTHPVTGAVLTTTAKLGGLVAVWRLLVAVPTATVPWPLLVAVLGVGSMTLGNLAAFAQTSLRRLLAYSTVSQVGYLLVPVAAAARSPLALPALLGYLAAYAVTNLAVFAVLAARPHALEIADQRGLARRHPLLAVALAVGLLGLVGTPPTVVFAGKLAGFTAAVDGGMTWLAVVAILNSIASLFYYLRWIAPVFSTGDPVLRDPVAPRARVVAVVLAAASVVGGVLVAFVR